MPAQRIARLLAAITLGAGLLALPASAPLPLGAPAVEAASLPRWTGSVDVYRSGTFSTQKTYLWCTAADVQIARNIVRSQIDHSRSSQSYYFSWMRARNRYNIPVSDGVDPQGWAAGMRNFVDSRYRLATFRTYTAALRSAATSLRLTNRPVGVLVARGGHAWLLTGFSATADPAATRNFTVTSVRVVGPLYGLQSRNGYDMPPDTRLSATAFKRFFTPWHYAGIRMVWEGLYGTVQATPANAAPTPAPAPQAAIALHPPIPAPARPMPPPQPPSSAAPAPAGPAEPAAPTTSQATTEAAPAGPSTPPPANGASASILSALAGLIVVVLLAAGAILGANRARPAGQDRRSRRTSRRADRSRPGSDLA
jgi:hypothetical protein